MGNELSADQVAQLIEESNKKKARSPRSKKYDFSDRSMTNWFKMTHRMGECSNENCESPEDKGGRNRMVSDIDGIDMCRICFTGGWNGE